MASLPLAPDAPPATTVILDGGLGTWLEQRGNDVTGALWSAQILLDNPAEITAAHCDFYQAGAQIATTCSYEVTYDGLATLGYSPTQVDEVLRTSVRLAQQARELADATDNDIDTAEGVSPTRPRWVAASVGPYGAGPGAGTEYDGAYGLDIADLAQWHRRRLAVLDSAGADALLCETIPSILEITALCQELAACTTPALLSINIRAQDPGTPHAASSLQPILADGSSLAAVADVVRSCPQIHALGVNCCSAPLALAAVKELSHLLSLPLMVYPNSGESWDHVQRVWQDPVDEDLSIVTKVPEFVAHNVRYIGGCCRVRPAEIQQIATTVASLDTP
ncbi:MAG: homocysteine S-methyltransferase [Corynebacterium sp.]|nr:homocysteine S-methyltransferase [Corynebacterium sp.]